MDQNAIYNRVLDEREGERQAEIQEQEQKQKQLEALEAEANPPKVDNPNEGELGRALVGGAIDIYNSVGSLPKLFDKRFYQPTDPENPYKFEAPWLITRKPIMRTQWGKFVRGGTELIGGLVGTGKVMWGIKGLKGLATAAKATRLGRVGLGAVQGATYDVISNQSQEQNLARSLIDIKPQWAGVLDPIATREDMSPAMKSMYNVGEGLGIGAVFDIAVEAGGWGLRSYSIKAKETAKKATKGQPPDPLAKAVDASSEAEYTAKTLQVDKGAKQAYERSYFRKLKNKGIIEPEVTIDQWRAMEDPWISLTDDQRGQLMQIHADKNDIDWGPYRDQTRRAKKQAQANKDLAREQLEYDLSAASPRENPAYYKGGDVTDNQALSSSSKPVKGVRDMIQIRNDPTQKYGSPRGTVTEANIRRIEYSAPGTITAERNALAKALVADPAYHKLYGEAMPTAIAADLTDASADLIRFLNDSGHSRVMDVSEKDIIRYIKAKDSGRPTVIEGIGVLNKSQLVATDTILGQLLYEARDLAKASLSVAGEIDVGAQGSLIDGILSRYSAIARLRKETSMLSSFELRKYNSGGKLRDTIDEAAIRGQASDAAASEVEEFKQLIRNDVDDDMLETFLHFTATGNGSKQTNKDLSTFFRRKLKGYKGADGYQRNAILNELQTVGVNSMLSGPKTPVRALVGTGLQTAMRPVATVLGALGRSDDRVLRGAYQSIGGMLEARNDAWRKAVAEWQSYNVHEEGWRGFTQSTQDREWNAMMQYFDQNGTLGERAQAQFANMLRELNRNSFLNYGPRIMKSMDVYFSQMIARGRVRQLAFDDVYSRMRDTGEFISDTDLEDLVKAAEVDFENKVFSADGEITDEMANFVANEAKLTEELTGFAKDLDRAFEKMPFLRPFFLFARTGVNALKMTSKYTPILNNFIGEHVDIMTKQWNDPSMLKYGIKSANDLEIAQATMRGRMAIGYGVTGTAAWMALNGQITGNGPPDRQLRDTWIQNGWQPRSIKIGGNYVSYEALEPFNMFFSFIADTVDAQKVMGDEWVGNNFSKAAYLLSANVTNKSFLAGLLQLQDLLTSQGRDAPRVAGNFINNQIPLGGLRNEIGKLLSPGMRELETGFWQTVGSRNLWADALIPGEQMPYKYDILNGERIRDWDPVTRLVNGVLPFNINVGTNETREMLFRSGVKLKQTFNTGPDGEPLEHHPDLKSRFQFFMGQQNLEAQLSKVLSNPQIKGSILKMEKDRDGGRTYDAIDSFHGPIIREIFYTAKKNAWKMLLQDPKLGGKANNLDYLHDMKLLGNKLRKQGDYSKEQQLQEEIKQIEKMPK